MCELQGGPNPDSDVRHDVAYNQWGSLNDSPQMWAVPTVLLIPAPSLDNMAQTTHCAESWEGIVNTSLCSCYGTTGTLREACNDSLASRFSRRGAVSFPDSLLFCCVNLQIVDPCSTDDWLSAVGGGIY